MMEGLSSFCGRSDWLFVLLCSGQGHGQGSQGPLQGAFPCELIVSSLFCCGLDVIFGELSRLMELLELYARLVIIMYGHSGPISVASCMNGLQCGKPKE
jgi:hypothetical protein